MNRRYRLIKLIGEKPVSRRTKLSSNLCMRSVSTMRLGKLALFSSIALALTIPAVAATRTHRSPASTHKAVKRPAPKSKLIGQRSIDDQRATQIQTALIKAGYLTGDPSGHWDSASEAAMQKLQ